MRKDQASSFEDQFVCNLWWDHWKHQQAVQWNVWTYWRSCHHVHTSKVRRKDPWQIWMSSSDHWKLFRKWRIFQKSGFKHFYFKKSQSSLECLKPHNFLWEWEGDKVYFPHQMSILPLWYLQQHDLRKHKSGVAYESIWLNFAWSPIRKNYLRHW